MTTTMMMSPKQAYPTIDFTRQDLVEEMLSKQPLNEDDEHCMRRSDLAALRLLPGNAVCVDCGKADPDWASISLGVFMCLECSGQHRSLGTHVSKVRSVRMDSWSSDQLGIMMVGGNQQCRDFLAEHRQRRSSKDDDDNTDGDNDDDNDDIRTSTTIAERYDCAVAMWYQQILKARRDDEPEPTEMPVYTPSRRPTLTCSTRPMQGLSSHHYHSQDGRGRSPTMELNSSLQNTTKHVENAIRNSQLLVVTKAKGLFDKISSTLSPKFQRDKVKVGSTIMDCVSHITDDIQSDSDDSSSTVCESIEEGFIDQ